MDTHIKYYNMLTAFMLLRKPIKIFWEYSDLCLLHYVELPVASIMKTSILTHALHCSLFTLARCMMGNSYNRVQSKQVDFHHLNDITGYNADRKEGRKKRKERYGWVEQRERERERER